MRRERLARLYVAAVITVGAGLLVALVVAGGSELADEADAALLLLAIAVLIGELVPIRLGPDDGEVAPSTTFTFALLLAYGTAAAALAQTVASLVADGVHRKSLVRSAFNAAQYVIAIAAAGVVYGLVTDEPLFDDKLRGGGIAFIDLVGVAAAGIAFFAVNTGSVAVTLALTTGARVRDQFASDLIPESFTESILIGSAPLAVLAVQTNLWLLPLLALPLVAVQRAARHARLSEHLAVHDALTGLSNRALLADRLRHALAVRARRGGRLAILLLDLDRFKVVNDSLGHSAGDELLRQVAARLTAVVRDEDTVARLGGDEFVVVLESISDPGEAAEVAARIQAALREPMAIEGRDIVVSASVGIVEPKGDEAPETLLRHADLAMYRAKSRGRARHEEFVDALAVTAAERLATETELRRALQEDELRLAYQVIVDLETTRPVAVEALVRWRHPYRGTLGPGAFLPVARESGLLVPLTTWVLEEALRQIQQWNREGADLGSLRVHVNVPAGQLTEATFADRVLELLNRAAVRPAQLCLEVTEDALVQVAGPGLDMLQRLRDRGVTIALDDFGTGYSSLSQLRHVPVDTLKIDGSFVRGLPRDTGIVKTIVDLASGLGLGATAEGIETDDQVRTLRDVGCERGQGYRFARPVSPQEFEATVIDRASGGGA